LVADGLQTLQGFGLLDDATIQAHRDGDPAQRSRSSDGLGRDLPPTARSWCTVARWRRRARRSSAPSSWWWCSNGFVLILIVTAVAIAGTVLVARNRLHITLGLLLGAGARSSSSRARQRGARQDPSVARTPAGGRAGGCDDGMADSLVKALGVLAVLF
jgi:hypothetical protein